MLRWNVCISLLRQQDGHYTHSAGVPLIFDVGLSLFLERILHSSKYPIHAHLFHTLLAQVQLERDGETIPRSTVRECVDILLRLSSIPITGPPASSATGTYGRGYGGYGGVAGGRAAAAAVNSNLTSVYTTEFEPELLKRSAEFYEDEAAEGVERGDASGYLRNVSVYRTVYGVWSTEYSVCSQRSRVLHTKTTGRTPTRRRIRPYNALPLPRHPKRSTFSRH